MEESQPEPKEWMTAWLTVPGSRQEPLQWYQDLWSPSRKGQETLAVLGYSPAHAPADQSPGAGPPIHPSFHIYSLGLIDQEA